MKSKAKLEFTIEELELLYSACISRVVEDNKTIAEHGGEEYASAWAQERDKLRELYGRIYDAEKKMKGDK